VPLLRRAPGFKGCCAFVSEDDHAVSVSIFDDRDSAAHADERVRGWLAANLRDLLPNPPEVTSGEVLVSEQETRPERRSADGEAFVMIQYYGGLTGSPDQAAQWVRTNLIPRLKTQSGFRDLYTFACDGNATRGGSVVLWDVDAAVAESRRMGLLVDAARLTGLDRDAPKVMMGRTAVPATA
jgi:hypothetical protein